MTAPVWLRGDPARGLLLVLHIQPGASRTEVAGEHGDALKVRLAAPPVDGKANACLIEFLAERLALPRSAVSLASGASSRRKTVRVEGLAEAQALQRLLEGPAGRTRG